MFLTGTGFGGIALALMSLCRPGDEILVSHNVYGPTEISKNLCMNSTLKQILYRTHLKTYSKKF